MSEVKLEDGTKIASVPIEINAGDRKLVVSSLKIFLIYFANYIYQQDKIDIFGENNKMILEDHAFVGSSANLVNFNISDDEFAHFKPYVGDIDIQVSDKHKEIIKKNLLTLKTFNGWRILGFNNHGNETSVLIYDQYEGPYQIDFEFVDFTNKDLDHKFLHSSSWVDTKYGIKGVHHKLLLNAIGLDEYKFSVTHGLRFRDESRGLGGIGKPAEISNILFGLKKNSSKIEKMYSFVGLCDLIHECIDFSEWGYIYDKFKKDAISKTKVDPTYAISYLKETLNA